MVGLFGSLGLRGFLGVWVGEIVVLQRIFGGIYHAAELVALGAHVLGPGLFLEVAGIFLRIDGLCAGGEREQLLLRTGV